MTDFADALKVVFIHEGGEAYTDDPNDPGGATKYGISLRFLRAEGLDLDGDGDVDADDVKGLTPEKSAEVYRQFFWDLVHGDHFDEQAIALKLFDMAVNMGPKRAIKLAQSAAGVPADGGFGPQTFRALNVTGGAVKPLLAAICSTQGGFYRGIALARPKSQKFLAGWLVRSNCTVYDPCKTCRWKGRAPLP